MYRISRSKLLYEWEFFFQIRYLPYSQKVHTKDYLEQCIGYSVGAERDEFSHIPVLGGVIPCSPCSRSVNQPNIPFWLPTNLFFLSYYSYVFWCLLAHKCTCRILLCYITEPNRLAEVATWQAHQTIVTISLSTVLSPWSSAMMTRRDSTRPPEKIVGNLELLKWMKYFWIGPKNNFHI